MYLVDARRFGTSVAKETSRNYAVSISWEMRSNIIAPIH